MSNPTIEQTTEAVHREFNHKCNILKNQRILQLNAQQNKIQVLAKAAEQEILAVRQIGQNIYVQFPNGFQQAKEMEITQKLKNDIWILQSEVNKVIEHINNLQNGLKNELDAFLVALSIKARQMADEAKDSEIQGQNLDITDDAGEDDNKSSEDKDTISTTVTDVGSDCTCNVKEGELGHFMKEQCYLWQLNHIANELTTQLQDCKQVPTMNISEKNSLVDEYNELTKKLQHVGGLLANCKTYTVSQFKENEMKTQNWRDSNIDLGKKRNDTDGEKFEEELDIVVENARADCVAKGLVFPFSEKIRITKEFYQRCGKQYGALMPPNYQNDKMNRSSGTNGRGFTRRNVNTAGNKNKNSTANAVIFSNKNENKNKIENVSEVAVEINVECVPDSEDIFDDL